MITFIEKQKQNGTYINEGVRITDNGKGRMGFNFSPEITACLPEHITLGYDDNKLYFVESDQERGYKVSKKNGMTGRIGIVGGKHYMKIKRFVGNHTVKQSKIGLLIEI